MTKDIPTEDEYVMEGFSEEEKAQLQDGGEEASTQVPQEVAGAEVAEPASPDAEAPHEASLEDAQGDKPKGPDERAAAERRNRELREAKAESARLREQYDTLSARTDAILETLKAQGQPKDEEADAPADFMARRQEIADNFDKAQKDGDFVEAERLKAEYMRLDIEEKQEQQRQVQEGQARQAQQEQFQALMSGGAQQLREAFANDPSFDSAYKAYASGLRYRAAVELGFVRRGEVYDPRGNPARWAKVLDRADEYARRDTAMGLSGPFTFADIVKKTASDFGWRPDAQPTVSQQQPEPVTSAPPAHQTNADRHMSLSSAGGGAAPARLDAKAIASMSEEDFVKAMQTPQKRAEMERIMGANAS